MMFVYSFLMCCFRRKANVLLKLNKVPSIKEDGQQANRYFLHALCTFVSYKIVLCVCVCFYECQAIAHFSVTLKMGTMTLSTAVKSNSSQ